MSSRSHSRIHSRSRMRNNRGGLALPHSTYSTSTSPLTSTLTSASTLAPISASTFTLNSNSIPEMSSSSYSSSTIDADMNDNDNDGNDTTTAGSISSSYSSQYSSLSSSSSSKSKLKLKSKLKSKLIKQRQQQQQQQQQRDLSASTREILSKINQIVLDILTKLNQEIDPTIAIPSNNNNNNNINSNTNNNFNSNSNAYQTLISNPLTTTTTNASTKSITNLSTCKKYTSTILLLSHIYNLLQQNNKSTTTREIYYTYITHFRSQRECDAIIVDVCNLLHVERVHLGLYASPKGWFCGSFVITEYEDGHGHGHGDGDGHGHGHGDGHGHEYDENRSMKSRSVATTINGTSLSSIQGIPITREWIYRSTAGASSSSSPSPLPLSFNESKNLPSFHIQSNAKCILIIEKEGIYLRLTEDRFFERYPCIIITGKGYPDIATRALVHVLHNHLSLPDDDDDDDNDGDDDDDDDDASECEVMGDDGLDYKNCRVDELSSRRRKTHQRRHRRRQRRPLPIYGISDCNPFGFHIIQTFYRGSDKRYCDGGERYSVPIQWLGLRPSLVSTLKDENVLPKEVYQSLTDLDKKKVEKLCHETNTFVHGRDNINNIYDNGIGIGDADGRKLEELELMLELGYKVELESLHWLGMDYITNWLFDALTANETHRKIMMEKEKQLGRDREHLSMRHTNCDDYFDEENEDERENDFIDHGGNDEYDLRLAV